MMTREDRFLAYIESFMYCKQYSPSVAEIAAHFKVSKSTARRVLAELQKSKRITMQKGKPRTIAIVRIAQKRKKAYEDIHK